jgi:hypothetical protein
MNAISIASHTKTSKEIRLSVSLQTWLHQIKKEYSNQSDIQVTAHRDKFL